MDWAEVRARFKRSKVLFDEPVGFSDLGSGEMAFESLKCFDDDGRWTISRKTADNDGTILLRGAPGTT